MNIPENSIPEELMARAHGIAVIPHVVKGAFGIGGQWGKGLMSQRREDGSWSAPAYIEIGGGSFGLQIGVQASDIVLVFTDEDGIKGILKGKLKLGADASATAGPVGRKAEVGTDVLLRSAVFAYSRSKGLFAGISLDGSVISMDDNANRKIYGKNVTGEDILLGKAVPNQQRRATICGGASEGFSTSRPHQESDSEIETKRIALFPKRIARPDDESETRDLPVLMFEQDGQAGRCFQVQSVAPLKNLEAGRSWSPISVRRIWTDFRCSGIIRRLPNRNLGQLLLLL